MVKIDRIGNVLAEHDRVIAYSSMRTGSSTIRMVQYEGIVVGFKGGFVRVKCVEDTYGALNKEFRVRPCNIFKFAFKEE